MYVRVIRPFGATWEVLATFDNLPPSELPRSGDVMFAKGTGVTYAELNSTVERVQWCYKDGKLHLIEIIVK